MTEIRQPDFPVVKITLAGDPGIGDEGPLYSADASEQVGSKEKIWCEHLGTHQKYLLKFARPNTGEDWAEKLASEIADRVLGLPRARLDLATYQDRPAVLSEFFPKDGQRLIHGNELLLEQDASYPSGEVRRVRKHTLAAVFDVLGGVRCPEGLRFPPEVHSAQDLFCGYLVLDVLIGNTDRHHENWGLLVARSAAGERILELAPTYDHGSSLGRELLDTERRRRLQPTDSRVTVSSYAQRARSAFYLSRDDVNPLPLRDLLVAARAQYPAAVAGWASRLAGADVVQDLKGLVDRVPNARMSAIAKDFACRLLEHNCGTIQDVVSGHEQH